MIENSILNLLTCEEIEIMGLIINGYKYKKISEILNISRYQVIKNVNSVVKKLNANGRVNAVTIILIEAKKLNII